MLSKENRTKLIRKATSLALTNYSFYEAMFQPGACFYMAGAVWDNMQYAIQDMGLTSDARCIVQGGSASWPFIDLSKDDGEQETHFSYMWNESPVAAWAACMNALQNGVLPEMHCWCVLMMKTSKGEEFWVIDSSTGFQEIQCKRMIGQDWTGKKLPKVAVLPGEELPDGWRYQAAPVATHLVMSLVSKIKSDVLERKPVSKIHGDN